MRAGLRHLPAALLWECWVHLNYLHTLKSGPVLVAFSLSVVRLTENRGTPCQCEVRRLQPECTRAVASCERWDGNELGTEIEDTGVRSSDF